MEILGQGVERTVKLSENNASFESPREFSIFYHLKIRMAMHPRCSRHNLDRVSPPRAHPEEHAHPKAGNDDCVISPAHGQIDLIYLFINPDPTKIPNHMLSRTA